MMKINGFNGTNTQTGAMGMAQANDSVSKNIQNQIANAQQKLQDLSSNEELSLEDKMKKRQEIQQEITNLNQQLRQHQIEQRKEQQSKKSSMDDMVAGTKNTSAKKGTGLSQAGMRAMISADSSMKQAKVQGSMTAQMFFTVYYAEKGDKMLHHFQGKIEIGTGNGGIISQLKMQNEMKLTDESWISYQQGKGNEEYQKYMD